MPPVDDANHREIGGGPLDDDTRTAEVADVKSAGATLRLKDGRRLQLDGADPQLRHPDHARAATVHAFQVRAADDAIAAVEARHPNPIGKRSFHVGIGRARKGR